MGKASVPKLCFHRAQQRWYVTLDRKEVYLSGKVPPTKRPPAEVQQKYDQAVSRWLAIRQQVPEPVGTDPTIDELYAAFYAHVNGPDVYVKNGKKTSEPANYRQCLRVLSRLYGSRRAADFRASDLRALREEFIEMGWARAYLNQQVSRVRRMFRWAVSHDLIPESVLTRLETVPDLKKSEAQARGVPLEGKVQPVEWSRVEATLPHLRADLADLVRVHWLLGCRAQDVCSMRTCDIDQAADPELWLYRPAHWKTEHHGGERLEYWVGKKAQEILRPRLRPDQPEDWLFHCRPNKLGQGCYHTTTYADAIRRACVAHGIEPWYPLQVRHARLSEIRAHGWGEHSGIEAAQAVARHESISTSEIYAVKVEALAKRVMSELG